jgi:hypothetical protein
MLEEIHRLNCEVDRMMLDIEELPGYSNNLLGHELCEASELDYSYESCVIL